jgi:pimeloyl-ACP methyl ester carboxylesterase
MRHPALRASMAVMAALVAAGCATTTPSPPPSPSAGPSALPSRVAPTTAHQSAAATDAPSASPVSAGRITVNPAVTLIDEPIAITLSGFAPDSEVTVRATTVGTVYPDLAPSGAVRSSAATFRADGHGRVDLRTQAPVSGSYDIANPMGLFWSMKEVTPADVAVTASPPPASADPASFMTYRYEIAAEVAGAPVARVTVDQQAGAPGVTMRDISDHGLLAQFYQPEGAGPFPVVILVAGASGGLATRRPKVLAAHGYAVLSLPYFRYTSPLDGTRLPTDTIDLPLEYFGQAIDWLQAQPAVDPKRIAMYGTSLGGEVAMLVAARYPQIKSVIAITPPPITWDGGPGHSSFSYKGKPVPNVVPFGLDDLAQPFRDAFKAGADPMATVPGILASINANPEMEAAIPRVEQIKGSVLIVSGTGDLDQPSTISGELFVDRLAKHKFAYPYRHVVAVDAGHDIDFPFVDRSMELSGDGGGTRKAAELAGEAMWPVVLEYLGAMH